MGVVQESAIVLLMSNVHWNFKIILPQTGGDCLTEMCGRYSVMVDMVHKLNT